MWSPKHWDLVARSFRFIGETGSRTLYVPLICRTNFGNEESMVRWIRKPLDKLGTYGDPVGIFAVGREEIDPSAAHTERTALQQAVVSLKKLADAINLFFEHDWPKYKDAVDAAKITFFEPYVPIKVDQ